MLYVSTMLCLLHASILHYMARYDLAKEVMVHAQDLLQSREASEAARCGRLSARSYVQDTLQACADRDGWAQVYLDTMLTFLYP